MLDFDLSRFDVVGLGVSPLDILTLVDHFPSSDEVQQAIEISVQGGGPVTTALVALSRLGCRVAMLDAVGNDWRSNLILDELKREKVCTDHILVRSNFTSAAASILVHAGSGERAICHFPGSAPELRADELPHEIIKLSKIVHLNGRHLEACEGAINTGKKSGVKISFDGGAGRYRPEIRHLIPESDYCIVAESFASSYTGLNTILDAGQFLLNEGPSLVVITAGLGGSWIFHQDSSVIHQAAFRMPATVDSTGCGDSYHGAFLFGLLKEFSIHQTACFASAVAALNSQKLGGRAGLPDYRTVIEFIEQRLPGIYQFPSSP